MISKLVKKLESYKGRIKNYGDLISQVLIRNPEESKILLEKLVAYLKLNKKVSIISLSEFSSRGLKKENRYLRFTIMVEFTCGQCGRLTEEQVNLGATSQPYQNEGKPTCSYCLDKYEQEQDYQDTEQFPEYIPQSKKDSPKYTSEEIDDLPF